jgi:hypothetical protein
MHTVHSRGVARTALQCASNNDNQQTQACIGKATAKVTHAHRQGALPNTAHVATRTYAKEPNSSPTGQKEIFSQLEAPQQRT